MFYNYHLSLIPLQEDLALNPFTCSIGIRACASFGSLILGKQFHAIICKYGFKDNLPVSNSIVDMYCRCMSLSEAKQYFNEMHQKDLITWNTMIAGLETFGSFESLKLFAQMVLLDVYPNYFTYTSIIAACANFALLNCGQQVHGVIIRRGFGWNTPLANALIDMYAKCGCIVDSRRIFDEMKRRDLVSWTSMMTGYGNHGYGREAVELFDEMVVSGITPDHVVFIGVLCACSHAGLVEEGLKYFNSMKTYNVCPNMEIYGCIVDLLGRAGRVTDAYELIEKMPFEADESIWGALLGSCKVHRNADLGKMAGQKILSLRPNAAETYVILSNIYAAERKWGEFAMMRKVMRGIGSKKEAGRSWIEVGNRVYSFAVGQRSSPHLDLAYEGLEILAWHMKEAGCESD